ncbi:probable pectinesterase 29 [Elaeis guineensis]|uniref:Pectinesterase n=1 Tax=Elaeis guineensis var. tenera TaxID=51953 RepID=A0A6I9S780_ELAGV|nr:probable pectinesterase 29 [Elaeis guineensis]
MQSPFFLFSLFFSLTQIFLYYDSVDGGNAVIVKNITVDKSRHGDFMTIQDAIDSVPDGNRQWIRIHMFLYYDFVDGYAVIVKNITVDQSGHGEFTTIQGAIDSIPDYNTQWIRIHVVAGIYREKAFIPYQKEYILIEGEGSQQTSIEWDEAVSPDLVNLNITHSNSVLAGGMEGATFSILANNFVIRDIAFKNTYDHIKYGSKQALAVYVSGDKGSFYRCAFFSYQDTLCDFTGRHYFSDCWIEGAIDFIFGLGQSIYMRSTLHSIKEGSQPGWLTAHAKTKLDAPGGFVFKYCTVEGGKTFLGRAWNSYSTVIFYNTYMADNIMPEGWDAWKTGNNAYQTTYAEDGCSGPGSNTANRVNWEKKLSNRQLKYYTSNNFIDREGWRSQQP